MDTHGGDEMNLATSHHFTAAEVERPSFYAVKLAHHSVDQVGGHSLFRVGTGRFAGPSGIAVGLDPSDAMLVRAAARGIETTKGIAEALPFPDSSFD
jgi:ubiquinone/menaquinone biosynthesis C-methylase UbiE